MKEREELLRQLISRTKDACDKKKHKRVIRTFLILSGVIYLLAFTWDEINSWIEFLGWLIGAPFLAIFIIYVAALILIYIHHGAMEDEKYIAKLEGELNATVRFNNRKNKEL